MDKRLQSYKLIGLATKYHGQEIHTEKLRAIIALEIAATPVIITRAIQLMSQLNLLEPLEGFRFRINKDGYTKL